MALIVEIARAKVNLTLAVRGKRADGYHELAGLVAFASDPADVVTFDTSRPRAVEVVGPFAAGIAGVNLLETTLALVTNAAHNVRLGHVRLDKQLPVAAGIGGGSADAAALLRALSRANPDLVAVVDWRSIARRLGADVPVCLDNRAAWMTGTGEALTPVGTLPRLEVVLVNPMTVVPADKTAQVFGALNAPCLPLEAGALKPPEIACRADLIGLIDGGNNLERAACKIVPQIADVLDALRSQAGCEVAAMSGAGPTCFGVFADAAKAVEAATVIAARHPGWWVQPSQVG